MKQSSSLNLTGRLFAGVGPTVQNANVVSWRQIISIPADNNQALWTFMRHIVFAILLTRSICDPIFSMFEVNMGGGPIGFGAVVNAVVIAIALAFVLMRPTHAAFAVFAIWTPFLLVSLAAVFYAPQFGSAARMFLVLVSYWAVFIIPFFLFRSGGDLRRFVLLVFASSIVPSLYSIVDIWRGLSDFAEFRLQSTFAHPNIYSFYLVLLLGLAFYVRASLAVIWPRGSRQAITLYIPIIIALIALTKTRSAWAASAAIYLFYAVRFERRLLFGILLVPLLLVVAPSLGDRFSDLTQGEEIDDLSRLNSEVKLNSLEWRAVLWESAIPAIVQKPLLGHGLESFRISTPGFFPLAADASEAGETDAHNFYLQILFEMGSVGIIAFIWLFGALSRQLAQGLRFDRAGVLLIFSILAAYLAESYSDNMVYYLSFEWYFWFVMGTICAWIGFVRSATPLNAPIAPCRSLHKPISTRATPPIFPRATRMRQ